MSALSRPLYSRAVATLAEHCVALPCSSSESDVVRVAQLFDVSPDALVDAVRKHWRHTQRMKRAFNTHNPGPFDL